MKSSAKEFLFTGVVLSALFQTGLAKALAKTTVASGSNVYNYVSCWSQGKGIAPLTGAATGASDMTAEKCASFCAGSPFFGLAAGSICYCGDFVTSGSASVKEATCSTPCAGDNTQLCGSLTTANLYALPGHTAADIIPSVKQTAGAFDYVSCYSDFIGRKRTLGAASYSSSSMTVDSCASFCTGFKYFGVGNGRECYCGNSTFAANIVEPEADCSYNCEGDPSQLCGAAARLNLYKAMEAATSASTSVSAAPSSTSPSAILDSPSSSTSAASSSSSSVDDPAAFSNTQVSSTDPAIATTSAAISASSGLSDTAVPIDSDSASASMALSDYAGPTGTVTGAASTTSATLSGSAATTSTSTDSASITDAVSSSEAASTTVPSSASAGQASADRTATTPVASSSEAAAPSLNPSGVSTTTTTAEPPPRTLVPGYPDVTGYSLVSCWAEPVGARALIGASTTSDTLTLEECASFCSVWPYFGVEYGRECYCAVAPAASSVAAPLSDCSMPCAGNHNQTCGGNSRLNLYHNPEQTGPSAPATVGEYEYFGCATDAMTRTLVGASFADDTMTLNSCEQFCSEKGFAFFGTEYGRECYCGNELREESQLVDAEECNSMCSGDSSQLCGQGNRLTVYKALA